jgi:hypothetical protein
MAMLYWAALAWSLSASRAVICIAHTLTATHFSVESPASTTVRRAQKRPSAQKHRKSTSFAILGTRNKIRTHNPVIEDFDRAAGMIELAWPAMDGTFQSAL